MSKYSSVALPKVEFESILLSITSIDTYKSVYQQLCDAIQDIRSNEYQALQAYKYLVEQQLHNQIPTQSTLTEAMSKFEGLDFKNRQIFPDSEVPQKVEIYSERCRRKRIATSFYSLPEEILEHGVTDHVINTCNLVSAQVKSDGTYTPVTKSYLDMLDSHIEFDGIPFLCPELDKRTGGIAKGTICTVLGASGSMKTTTVVNICYNAVKLGKNVAYLSLEESPFQLMNKLMSRVSFDLGKQLPVKAITQDQLTDQEKKTLKEEVYPHFMNLKGNFYIIGEEDLGDYNLSTLEAKLKEVDELAKKDSNEKNPEDTDHGIDIVVVDHIQLLKFADAYKDEFSVINTYVSFFRQQSLSFLHQKRQTSVILLSQANREGIDYAAKHNGAYKMQHVAEANEIERSSSYIISVYTDAMSQVSKLIKMGAVKLRGAPLPMDTVNVYADGEYYMVGETSTPEQREYSAEEIGISTEQQDSYSKLNDELLAGDIEALLRGEY